MFKQFDITDYFSGGYSVAGTVGNWLKDALIHSRIFNEVRIDTTTNAEENICTDTVTASFQSDDLKFAIAYQYGGNHPHVNFSSIRISDDSKTYIYQSGGEDKYRVNTIIAFDGGIRFEWCFTPDIHALGTNTNTYYFHSIVLTKIYKLINQEEQKYGDVKLALIQHAEQDTKNDSNDLTYIIQSVGKLNNSDTTSFYNYFTSKMLSDTDYTTFGAILFPHGYQTRNVVWSPFTEFIDWQGASYLPIGSESSQIIVIVHADHDRKLREYKDDINQTSVFAYRIGHLLILDDQSKENAFY